MTWQGRILLSSLGLVALLPALLFAVLPQAAAALLSATGVLIGVAGFFLVALRHAEPLDTRRRPPQAQRPPVGPPGA